VDIIYVYVSSAQSQAERQGLREGTSEFLLEHNIPTHFFFYCFFFITFSLYWKLTLKFWSLTLLLLVLPNNCTNKSGCMENSNYAQLLTCVLIHEGFKCYSSCGGYKIEIGRHERVLFLLMRHKGLHFAEIVKREGGILVNILR
jgi:hypothetical protein